MRDHYLWNMRGAGCNSRHIDGDDGRQDGAGELPCETSDHLLACFLKYVVTRHNCVLSKQPIMSAN